jgi:hypothetical protein
MHAGRDGAKMAMEQKWRAHALYGCAPTTKSMNDLLYPARARRTQVCRTQAPQLHTIVRPPSASHLDRCYTRHMHKKTYVCIAASWVRAHLHHRAHCTRAHNALKRWCCLNTTAHNGRNATNARVESKRWRACHLSRKRRSNQGSHH